MWEGSWQGIKVQSIDEPGFGSVGEYETARYGRLQRFALFVPPGSRIIKAGRRCMRWFLVITPDGREFGFELTLGNAAVPSDGREISVKKVKEIIDEIREQRGAISESIAES